MGRPKGTPPWNKGLKTGLVPKTAFKKGCVPWNTGLTKDTNVSLSLVSASREKYFKENPDKISKYWLGKLRPDITGANSSTWRGGKPSCLICGKRLSGYKNRFCSTHKGLKGDKSPNWKGGITQLDKLERVRFRKTTQRLVFERDNYTCQRCSIIGVELHVDHIKPWSEFKEGRFDLDNCRTLCMKCHYFVTYNKEMPEGVKSFGRNLSQFIKEGF